MKRINIFVKIICLLIVSILVGTILMIGLYSVPTDRIKKHAEESINLYNQNENKVENWVGYLRYGVIDNSTDSLMVNIALCREYDSVIENALLNPRYYSESDELSSSDFNVFLNEDNISGTYNYSRYWHGYLLYLIPCLFFTNVGGTRVVMMIVEFLLAMLLLYKLSKINPIYMFAYAVTLLFINPITCALNLQNADIYILSMLFSIVVLYFNNWLKQNNRYYLLFTFIGICTAFFDFLTYPLVAWGMPMITMILINKDDIKKSIINIVLCAVSWIFGYAGMWFGKWIMASLLTNANVIEDALSSFILRSSNLDNSGSYVSFSKALNLFKESVNDIPMTGLLLLSILVIVVYSIINKKRIVINKNSISKLIPYILIGLSSFAWAFVVRNHFATHQFLEYRTMAVSLLSLLIILINIFDYE